MAKRKTTDDEAPGFEDSLSELQQIVQSLEEGSQGLEESLQQFERGIGLLRSCYALLESAEQKIEILTGFDAEGKPLTEAFDASSTLSTSEGASRRRRGSAAPAKSEDGEDAASGAGALF